MLESGFEYVFDFFKYFVVELEAYALLQIWYF